MPYIGTIDKRKDLEAVNKALADALDSISEIKRLKGQQMMQDAMLGAMQPQENDTPDARYARVLDAIKTTRAGAAQKPIFGVPILDRALGAFNPNVPLFAGPSNMENYIMQQAISNFPPDPYRQAQIESLRSLTEQRRFDTEQAKNDVRNNALMEIQSELSVGEDISGEKVALLRKKANEFGYDVIEKTIPRVKKWGRDIPEKTGYELAPKSNVVSDNKPVQNTYLRSMMERALPKAELSTRSGPKSPRPELNNIWPKTSDVQKSKVVKALMNGATIQEILEALKLEGIK